MSTSTNLSEYRCHCGKLLFKAPAVVTFIEIKCLRCKQIQTFGTLPQSDLVSFALVIDEYVAIVDACQNAAALGYEHSSLVGKPLPDILPLVQDVLPLSATVTKDVPYALERSPLVLHDGETVGSESYIVQLSDNDKEYGVFSIIRGDTSHTL